MKKNWSLKRKKINKTIQQFFESTVPKSNCVIESLLTN